MDILIVTPEQRILEQVMVSIRQTVARLQAEGWALILTENRLTFQGLPDAVALTFKSVSTTAELAVGLQPPCAVLAVGALSPEIMRALPLGVTRLSQGKDTEICIYLLQQIKIVLTLYQKNRESAWLACALKASGLRVDSEGATAPVRAAWMQVDAHITTCEHYLQMESNLVILREEGVKNALIAFLQRQIYRFESEIALTIHTLEVAPPRIAQWAESHLELDYAQAVLRNVQQQEAARGATAATTQFIAHQTKAIARLEAHVKTLAPETWFTKDSEKFRCAEHKLAVLQHLLRQVQQPAGFSAQCLSQAAADELTHHYSESQKKRYRAILTTLLPGLKEDLQKSAKKRLLTGTARMAPLLALKADQTTQDIQDLTLKYTGPTLKEHLLDKPELKAVNRAVPEPAPALAEPLSLADFLTAVLDHANPCCQALHVKRGLLESPVMTGLARLRAALTNLVSLTGPEFAPLLPAEEVFIRAQQLVDARERAAYIQEHFSSFRGCRAFQTELAARFMALVASERVRYQAKNPWGVEKMFVVDQKIDVLRALEQPAELPVSQQLTHMLFQYDPQFHVLWQRLHPLHRHNPEIIGRLLELQCASYDPERVSLTQFNKVSFALTQGGNVAGLFRATQPAERTEELSALAHTSPRLCSSSDSE